MGALFAVLLAAAASAAEPSGKALFDSHGCRSCHAVAGVGGNVGPDLSLVGVRRGESWLDRWLASPRSWKADTLMPDPKLADGDRRALASWLASQRAPPPRGLGGKALFAKAGCSACHGAAGRGGHPNPGALGGVVPALRDTAGTYTLEELRTKIRRGVAPAEGAQVRMPEWGAVLGEPEIGALAEYVLSLARKTDGKEW